MEIDKYIEDNKNISIIEISRLAIRIIKEELEKLGIDNVKIKLNYLEFRSYSSVKVNRSLDDITINVNINKILLENRGDSKKLLFRLYNTIIHEIEHVKTLTLTKKEDFYDYDHLLILMEYISQVFMELKKANVNKIKLNGKIGIKNFINIGRYMSVNYEFSTSEIKSQLVAYIKSLEVFREYLTEEEIKRYERIILELRRLDNCVEAAYDSNKIPIMKFSTSLMYTLGVIKSNKEYLGEFGILKNLIKEDGNLKNIYELYLDINDENKEMYERLMIEEFISIRADYRKYFEDIEFKEYLERIIANYMNQVVDYFININEMGIFINNKNFIKENLKVLTKISKILSKNIEYYGLTIQAGMIIDSSKKRTFKKDGE